MTKGKPETSTMAPSRPRSLRALVFGSKRRSSPEPPSPTFSDVTHASAINFGPNGPDKIITRANLKASVNAYDNVPKSLLTVNTHENDTLFSS